MKTYSIDHVDPTGFTGLSEDLKAANDQVALEMAERCFRAGVVEVWDGHRLVGRLEAHENNRVE